MKDLDVPLLVGVDLIEELVDHLWRYLVIDGRGVGGAHQHAIRARQSRLAPPCN